MVSGMAIEAKRRPREPLERPAAAPAAAAAVSGDAAARLPLNGWVLRTCPVEQCASSCSSLLIISNRR